MPRFLASYLVQVKSSQHELVLVVSGESWSGPGDHQAIPRAAESVDYWTTHWAMS